ncbi:MAG TPA: GNAT family N-acetyltransferase [Roseiflexaceae bacterium]|nr:GNAT family N-acetyltransferase [Roseiflexaceae bacterium]
MSNHLSNQQLIDIHINTLYLCDADGRLRFVREPGEPYAPGRFAMVRTSTGNSWRFRHDLPAPLVGQLDALCRAEPLPADLRPEPLAAARIRAALAEHAPVDDEYRGPAYWIPASDAAPPAEAVLIDRRDAAVLEAHFPWRARLLREVDDPGPIAAVVVDGTAVAVCSCARLSPAAAEAGVDTHESARRQGFASAVVARWAAAVRARGLLPMYSTSWDNLASQSVARRLGMVLYGEDWSLT